MGTVIPTILVTAPLAFMVGWLVSKALFRYLSYAALSPAVLASPDDEQKTSVSVTAESQCLEAATTPNQPASANERPAVDEAVALHEEIRSLREAVAEGEHAIAELKRDLAEKLVPLEAVAPEKSPDILQQTEQHRLLKAQQVRVTERDQRISEFEALLQEAGVQAVRAEEKFSSWRERIKPLAHQFRQQRMIISELREELRLRDLRQQEMDAAKTRGAEFKAGKNPQSVRNADPALNDA